MIRLRQAELNDLSKWSLSKASGIFLKLFSWLIGSSALPLAVLAANPSSTAPAVLTNVFQVLNLTREQAAQNIPVHLRGVVTYADAAWEIWFIQDATAGIFLYRTKASPVLVPGQQIEVEGVSGLGGFAPIVIPRKITMAGRNRCRRADSSLSTSWPAAPKRVLDGAVYEA